MRLMAKLRRFGLLAAAAFAAVGANNPNLPPDLNGIGIDQKLDAQVPLDTSFHDETGASVPLRTYFGRRPVLLVPVYYRCPMLCSQVLSGVVAAMRPLSLKPGRDFEVVAISFDPADTAESASKKREQYSHSYSSRAGTQGWHFLVGSEPSIHAVMQAIGFHYRWDSVHNMFIHASGVMLLTPTGRVSRYLYGVEYEPKDLKLGLIESSQARIGSAVDRILLLCYHYDPKTGKYGAVVINMLRLAAVLMVLVLGASLFFFWRRDLRQHRNTYGEVPRG
jgi:protein SCO1/2